VTHAFIQKMASSPEHYEAGVRNGSRMWLSPLVAALLALLAACGSSGSSSTAVRSTSSSATSHASTRAVVNTSQCGTKPGVMATGTPIKLGAIVTKQPGVDLTDVANMAQAYFMCVNDNGGINGHRIDYFIETEQTQPAQIAADAKLLVDGDHVVGMVGNTSILECTVDHAYWEKLGYMVVDSGRAPECYATPNSAPVNMGPRYSSDGAVQYALTQHVSKVVFDQSNVPGTGTSTPGSCASRGPMAVTRCIFPTTLTTRLRPTTGRW
jgi:branched-chain amino acid transport system substrate-binding protein